MAETSEPASGSVRQKAASLGSSVSTPTTWSRSPPSRRVAPARPRVRWSRAWFQSRHNPGELLADQGAVDGRGARAAVSLMELGVHQSDLPGLVDDALRPGGIPVVFPGDWPDLVLREVVRHVADVALLFGEGEIKHRLALRRRTELHY